MSTTILPIEKKSSIWATGLALFSMFFGAGNLIFPLLVGKAAGEESYAALGGLAVSAVAFPFLGLIAMMLYQGDLHAFLNRCGKVPAAMLLFVLYMSQGPVGSMPRLFTLMHASIEPFCPFLPPLAFSLLLSLFLFFLIQKPSKLIALLGHFLTPLLLLTLGILLFFGLLNPPSAPQVAEGAYHHFAQGLKGGYQTLDLTAALLFATLILPHLAKGVVGSPLERQREIRRNMIGASLIAAALLMVSYISLSWLSSHYSWTLGENIAPERLLHSIAAMILGPMGGAIASAAIFLACLTTALTLAAVFGRYLQEEVLRGKVGHKTAMGITLGITIAMSSLGFSGIAQLWGPILEVLYPGLIALCIWNIRASFKRSH
jgi:LIVCS family branched-chain amino acid:cation transporter